MPIHEGPAPVAVVCDDRAEVRHVVGRLLDRCGFSAVGAVDAYPALRALAREHQPAVVVVTLPLPGMNGLRAVREVHEDAPDCQIVLLSAFGQLDVAAVEAGAAALVPEDDLQALQSVLCGIAAAPRRVDVSLPDPRAQVAVPDAVVPTAATVA